jgi:hypothetical protein
MFQTAVPIHKYNSELRKCPVSFHRSFRSVVLNLTAMDCPLPCESRTVDAVIKLRHRYRLY